MICIILSLYCTLRILLESDEGPLDEKFGTRGAGLESRTVVVGRIVATGLLYIIIYMHKQLKKNNPYVIKRDSKIDQKCLLLSSVILTWLN